MAAPPVDMLAIDIDGTLLGRDGHVSEANRAAIRAARAAGVDVTLCTGRGLVECVRILEQVQQADPVVVAGGAIVACPASRRTLHRFPMELGLVQDLVNALTPHGHAVMILKDTHAAGYDYLIVAEHGERALDPVTKWWFDHLSPNVRYVRSLEEDEHPEHTVRLGVCGTRRATRPAADSIAQVFADRAAFHHFGAVTSNAPGADPEDATCILEIFDPVANKWAAIERLAELRGVPTARIAAIGDEVNDTPMIRRAGLGIAMGNAIDEVKDAADHVTLPHHEDGVAHAIDNILSGRWKLA